MIAVHAGRFERAAEHIDVARRLVHQQLATVLPEGYGRAYPHIVRLQQLSELEEIVMYKTSAHLPERQRCLVQMWTGPRFHCE